MEEYFIIVNFEVYYYGYLSVIELKEGVIINFYGENFFIYVIYIWVK